MSTVITFANDPYPLLFSPPWFWVFYKQVTVMVNSTQTWVRLFYPYYTTTDII